MFNPRPEIQRWPILPGHDCLVIDDALLEPERWVALATRERAAFATLGHNAYPGVELRMPDGVSAKLEDFFTRHVRSLLGARRIVRMYSRLAMVTAPPSALAPAQSICHRDRMTDDPDEHIAASVLYLFKDAGLGGTSFFRPRKSERDTAVLVHDSSTLPGEVFFPGYRLPRAYMTESNDWFEKVLTVPARWNRLIFYDGHLFHGGDIRAPERLTDDPSTGRLTLNGFFICRRRAG
jgi:Family of unknown function (DUF6445)